MAGDLCLCEPVNPFFKEFRHHGILGKQFPMKPVLRRGKAQNAICLLYRRGRFVQESA